MSNRYAGVPHDIKGRLNEAATKALEIDIRNAITELTNGHSGRYEAVITILASLIGEADDQ